MSTVERLEYYRTAERPDLQLWLLDEDGNLVDFSTGYTFEFKLGIIEGSESEAIFTKASGIVGAVGSGTEPTGNPNVTIAFDEGELDDVDAETYRWQLRAISGGRDRVYQGWIEILGILV